MAQASVEMLDMDSTTIGESVPLAVLTPPDFDPATESLPLCILLHGGGGDRSALVNDQHLYAQCWADGSARRMVIVAPSSGPLRWYADPWGDFIADELPDFMAGRYNSRSDRDGVVLTGRSMGGFGTLKTAFLRPDRFVAIAVHHPAVEPGFTRAAATPRNTFYRFPQTDDNLWGTPVNEELWAADNPANLAVKHADAIRDSGMEIYIDAGDQDTLNLQDGTEFLHRTLWDLDIRHEYHLVRWADHVGTSIARRVPESFQFLSDALGGGLSAPKALDLNEAEQAWSDWMSSGGQGEAQPIDLSTERGPALLGIMMEPKRTPALELDETFARSYGNLPN
jgi:S-formylglutathione hydrolase